MKVPERYRYNGVTELRSTAKDGNNGLFVISHYRINNYEFRCIAEDGKEGWEHVSVSVAPYDKSATRCPTWEEMCFIKDQFWSDDEEVIQIHPKKSEYINAHDFCLHLWREIKNIKHMSYYLFLDDVREPFIAANNVNPIQLRFLYRIEHWTIVRSYEEFVNHIIQHDVPVYVSLDYDLGKEGSKTGYDCCVWLIDYCNQQNKELPEIICHTWNSTGRNQIMDLVKAVRKD